MLLLYATVVLLLSYHRYFQVYCHPDMPSVMSHREPSSQNSLDLRTAQNSHAPVRAVWRFGWHVVRRTQSLIAQPWLIFLHAVMRMKKLRQVTVQQVR